MTLVGTSVGQIMSHTVASRHVSLPTYVWNHLALFVVKLTTLSLSYCGSVLTVMHRAQKVWRYITCRAAIEGIALALRDQGLQRLGTVLHLLSIQEDELGFPGDVADCCIVIDVKIACAGGWNAFQAVSRRSLHEMHLMLPPSSMSDTSCV
jgi:hypothetical protein